MARKFIPYGTQWVDEEDVKEVVNVLSSDWITTGPKIIEFENYVAKYIGCKFAAAVNSGTSGLDISVASLGIGRGEIITTPFSFVSSTNAIVFNSLKPIFADINRETLNIDPNEIRKKITNDTKAILYVDYGGHPCDIEEIKEIAEENNLFLIEDASHALGAEYKGRKVGTFADLSVFSFHPVKHITTGEGGMVTSNNEKLIEKCRMLRNNGIDIDAKKRFGSEASWEYDVKFLGRNYRITDFQAALGISQLKKLEFFLKKRQEISKIYNEGLSKEKNVSIPTIKKNVRHAWHIYTILLDRSINRDKFFSMMRKDGIGVNVHYIPVYRHSFYAKNYEIVNEDFPVTEDTFKRIITLPLYPKMREDDVKYVIERVRENLKKLG